MWGVGGTVQLMNLPARGDSMYWNTLCLGENFENWMIASWLVKMRNFVPLYQEIVFLYQGIALSGKGL